jgi:tetratricopeptide (TPR) repeat protein
VMSGYLNEPDSDEDENIKEPIAPELAEAIQAEVSRIKDLGGTAFKNKDYEEALARYSECVKMLKENNLPRDAVILANRSATYLALKRYVPACHDATQSAEVDPDNWKAHWRVGVSIMAMAQRKFRTKQAVEAFTKCASCPNLPVDKKSDVMKQLGLAKSRLEQQDAETPMPDMSNCAPS